MNTIFFLVFFMYLPDGTFTTAYRSEPFQTLKQCKEVANKDAMHWTDAGAVNVNGACIELPPFKDSHQNEQQQQQPAKPKGNYL